MPHIDKETWTRNIDELIRGEMDRAYTDNHWEARNIETPVTREEFDELAEKVEAIFQAVQITERTVYGIQQMLGKAAEYKGKPRGRLPR